jgi:glutathione S-transferase
LGDLSEAGALKLHYTRGSPFARIVRVLVRELDLDCDEEVSGFPPSADYFAVNPLGQIPALETADGIRFPTRIIIDYLLGQPRRGDTSLARSVRRSEEHWQDDRMLAVLLAMGDALAAMKYQAWAGLRPGGKNLIGFDPANRHLERVERTLDWLESIAAPSGFLPDVLSVQDIALSCFILWTEARGPIAWRGRPKLEAIVANCANRSSFLATGPPPWP